MNSVPKRRQKIQTPGNHPEYIKQTCAYDMQSKEKNTALFNLSHSFTLHTDLYSDDDPSPRPLPQLIQTKIVPTTACFA